MIGQTKQRKKDKLKHIDEVSHEYKCKQEVKKNNKNTSTIINHHINYDPSTGKKISETKETKKVDQSKTESYTIQQWAKEKLRRETCIESLRNMAPENAKIDSSFWNIYIKDFTDAIEEFKTFRQFKYPDHKTDHSDLIWEDPLFAARFLFDIKVPGLPPKNPNKKHVYKMLACLWTIPEMLQFCNNEVFYKLAGKEEPVFMITREMMSWYILGHVLFKHLGDSNEIWFRTKVQRECKKLYFPKFDRLQIPQAEELPTAAIFTYSFEHIPDPEDLRESIPVPKISEQSVWTPITGETGIGCDGLFVRLFSVYIPIFNHFQSRATKPLLQQKDILDTMDRLEKIKV